MKHLLITASLLILTSPLFGFDHNHITWDEILKTHARKGFVRYKKIKSDPSRLNAYLKSLATLSTEDFQSFTQDQKLAFWINAYNAITVKAIIDHYPIKSSFLKSAIYPKNSIRQIDGVWDKLEFTVMGREMTLNNIEHDTLRKNFDEPRIHMALVCAAYGCPRLRDEAYTGEDVQNQLADDARRFLKLPFQFRVDPSERTVHLSSIFKWFGEDFIPRYGTDDQFTEKKEDQRAVLNFILMNLDDDSQAKIFMMNNDFDIEYLDYDWTLNELKREK